MSDPSLAPALFVYHLSSPPVTNPAVTNPDDKNPLVINIPTITNSAVTPSEPAGISGWGHWPAGVDEVGRGALFGPVVAAAVILTAPQAQTLKGQGVRDSKQLRPARREEMAEAIRATATSWGLGWCQAAEIDRLNILQASLLAMRRAIAQLVPAPTHCLVDGCQPIPGLKIPQTTVIKGDQQWVAIAAASILAKVHRDRWITALAPRYPHYDLAANKGYGTRAHRQGLADYGPTPEHRLSFAPCQVLPLGRSPNDLTPNQLS